MNAGLVMEVTRDLMPGILDDLNELRVLSEGRPDCIIHDSMCAWGKLIARLAVPCPRTWYHSR
jgi:hypothetical protein